jgi:hypothetical protein
VGLKGRTGGLIREGHGLGNVRRRLKTLYRQHGSLDLLPGPGGPAGRGAVARLRLPGTGRLRTDADGSEDGTRRGEKAAAASAAAGVRRA